MRNLTIREHHKPLQYFAACGLLGAATSLVVGPPLASVTVFALGAVAMWRTNKVVVGLGTTALGLVAATLAIPFGPLATDPLTVIGIVVAALLLAAPFVHAAAIAANGKVPVQLAPTQTRSAGRPPVSKWQSPKATTESEEVVVIPLVLFFVPYSCRYSGESPAVPN